jgi:hypothetical protein
MGLKLLHQGMAWLAAFSAHPHIDVVEPLWEGDVPMGRSKIALAAVFGLMSVGLVVGQPGGGFPGGGFPGGGSDPFSLVQRKDVQKELKITDEQLEKIRDAVSKAVTTSLSDKQVSRLDQLILQKKGATALKDSKIQSKLQLSKTQKEDIKSLLADFEKDSAQIRKEEGFGAFKKIGELRKELNGKLMGVLNANQKKTYEEMTGDTFKFDTGGFKGPGGDKKKPKGDA